MGICWYCHWGWPKKVVDIYQQALDELGGFNDSPLLFGPAHIVWEDENFEDHNIKFCLKCCDEKQYDYTQKQIAIVKESLERLLAIPVSERCVEPKDYDEEHPENYPPPSNIEMQKM